MATSEKIKLNNVRLSFPRLFKPKAFQEGQDPRFEASFLLDPSDKSHAAIIKQIKATAKELATEEFGEVPKSLKLCFGDGDEKEYDGYEGMFYVTSSNKTRPTVVDRDLSPLVEEDGKPYAGCYVNGTITLWVMNNQFGKRINANLRAVQFVKDGEAFGVKPVDAEEEFDALEGDDGAEENYLDD
jgi:hypothetical protein